MEYAHWVVAVLASYIWCALYNYKPKSPL